MEGGFRIIDDEGTSSGKALQVPAHASAASREVYPAHTEIGRTTTTFSEFTIQLRRDNLGVLLRRTLDYKFPNQRAEVYVAESGDGEAQWERAGIWYLAGSNTCYHSYPRAAGKLGRTNPVVQTSNRQFRDDEFLIPRKLTQGRSSLRVRIKFTPVKIPLLPHLPVEELAWSEIRYHAYCYVMPEFSGAASTDMPKALRSHEEPNR